METNSAPAPTAPAAAPAPAPAPAAAPAAPAPAPAAAPAPSEPVAASSGAPVAPESAPVASAPEPTPFPSADGYAWSDWDPDSGFGSFDERVAPWLEGLYGHMDGVYSDVVSQANNDARYWQNMYNAVAIGDEDPRVAEMSTQLETFKTQLAEAQRMQQEYAQQLEQQISADSERYFAWFEQSYADRIKANQPALKASLAMMERIPESVIIEPHVAFEIAELGPDAVTQAEPFLARGVDAGQVLSMLKQVAAANAPRKPTPRPSAALVAGQDGVGNPRPPAPKPVDMSTLTPHERRLRAARIALNKHK